MATLKDYIERIEALEEEKKGLTGEIKDVMQAVRDDGYDAKIVRAVLKRRKLSEAERIAKDQLLATYEAALADQGELPFEERQVGLRKAEIATQSASMGKIGEKLESSGFEADKDDGVYRLKTAEAVG